MRDGFRVSSVLLMAIGRAALGGATTTAVVARRGEAAAAGRTGLEENAQYLDVHGEDKLYGSERIEKST